MIYCVGSFVVFDLFYIDYRRSGSCWGVWVVLGRVGLGVKFVGRGCRRRVGYVEGGYRFF